MGCDLTNKDYKFFEYARRAASKSTYKQFHIGAVLVYHGRIIGEGWNTNKTSPTQKHYNKNRKFNKSSKPIQHKNHAEIAAFRSVSYQVDQETDWSKVKIYIYRICNDGSKLSNMARPCPACMAAIKEKGIKTIYYTSNDGYCKEWLY